MSLNTLSQEISQLDAADRIELIGEIWNGLVDQGIQPGLSDSQRAELRRRLAEHRASPDDVLTWSQVQERLPTTR